MGTLYIILVIHCGVSRQAKRCGHYLLFCRIYVYVVLCEVMWTVVVILLN